MAVGGCRTGRPTDGDSTSGRSCGLAPGVAGRDRLQGGARMSSYPPSAGPNFDVEVASTDGRPVVVVRGEVDIAVMDPLWSCVERACDGGGPLVMDCSQVTFMGSTGVNVLVRAYRRLGRVPGTVVVRNPSVQVQQVLELSGINDVVVTVRPHDVRPQPRRPTPGPHVDEGAKLASLSNRNDHFTP
jgi:anti-anti-sigma factor